MEPGSSKKANDTTSAQQRATMLLRIVRSKSSCFRKKRGNLYGDFTMTVALPTGADPTLCNDLATVADAFGAKINISDNKHTVQIDFRSIAHSSFGGVDRKVRAAVELFLIRHGLPVIP